MDWAWVFLGGGFGSMCRYGIALGLNRYELTFPLATLCANIVSCILLGFLVSWSLKSSLSPSMKWFLMVGFCGGFSTFSTFSNETFHLLQGGEVLYGILNIFISILVCLVAIGAGIYFGHLWLSNS